MAKTAWVFPGQGSQTVGMGADLADVCADRLAEAETIIGRSVLEICQDETLLSDTRYTQPCLYVVECALTDALKDSGQRPNLVAGHSLGEYSALYAASVFSFVEGLKLVKRRAELMSQASEGRMAALMGFDRDQLDAKIAKTVGVVLANDNNAGQVVISGTPAGVDAVIDSVKCKRAVRLNVSGAFHSPLMADASKSFESVLAAIEFDDASIPVMSNVDPTPETNAEILKKRLVQQMTGSVRWREISLGLSEAGVEEVVEIGPGKVLAGLIKRTCKGLKLVNVSNLAAIES
ncbi:malonyl CoA-acyl carrier protein transacylase [Synechococcus sp. PCC 7335]|uniref:ACP S-malonyltransferase n=1 Tax=Synechococcus sp. (strain ATCC 29403 / PCC 7335) TaxID=91464 RepID=UPI00017ED597|nr:ACP S-malonyltransferase [Synechococcus sp. PCC 7335]EDX84071.1 malonyl CoA-acyl carrier protein transacylase [Synechococcus sp. PCC 7335]